MRLISLAVPALLIATSGFAVTHAAGSVPSRTVARYVWVVKSVGAPYRTYGAWQTCLVLTPSKSTAHAACGGKRTTSNSVSGSVGVDAAGVSASVGFDVTQTYTVSTWETFTIPAKAGGVLQWRSVFSTRDVHETEYLYATGTAGKAVATQTVHANKFVSPTFRYEP